MGSRRLKLEDFRKPVDQHHFVKSLMNDVFGVKEGGGGRLRLDADEVDEERQQFMVLDTDSGLRQVQFDMQPFERAAKDMEQHLKFLQREADSSIAILEKDLKDAELNHQKRLKEFMKQIKTMFGNFKSLDYKISKVSSTIGEIGERLELVNQQIDLVTKGSAIINHFLEFNSGKEDQIDSIFSSDDPEDLLQSAKMIQILFKVSSENRIENTEKALSLITKYAGFIEQRLLGQFFRCRKAGNVEAMQDTAKTLLQFEGGHLISMYIFECISSIADPSSSSEYADVLAFNEDVHSVFDSTYELCSQEFNTIYQVFPAPENLIRTLLERVFQDRINLFLQNSLNGRNLSKQQRIIMLESAFDKAWGTVNQLKSSLDILPENLIKVIELVLEDQFEAVFSYFRKIYMQLEIDQLSIRCETLIAEVFNFEGGSERDASPKKRSPTSIVASSASEEFRGKIKKGKVPAAEIKMWLDRTLKQDVVDTIIMEYSQALERCVKLSDPKLLAHNVYKIINKLLKTMVIAFWEVVCDCALGVLSDIERSVESDAFFFFVINGINTSIQRFEAFFQDVVNDKLSSAPNLQKTFLTDKSSMLTSIERKLEDGLQRFLDAFIKYCHKILTNEQKKSDFRPKDDDPFSDGTSCTKACHMTCKAVRFHVDMVQSLLDGRNLDSYLLACGSRFYK
jgi:hypothetical protein